jgi:teichuronic acid biosynthesis glycosyltransferase TuaG
MELVSIITPTYNSEKYIKQMIDSVINQSYKNWELLITDDCSTDNTIQIVQEFIKNNNRIKLFRLSKNSGAGISRNYSIKMAQGKYIAFCDSDDLWHPNKLKNQIEFMSKFDLAFSYTNYQIIDNNGIFLKNVFCPLDLTYDMIVRNCYIGCLTVMYDVSKLGPLFFDKIKKRQDWILWIQILHVISFTKGLNEVLASYRTRNNSISASKIKLVKYNWLVYYKFLNYTKLGATFMLFRFLFYYFLFKKFGIYRLSFFK